jgi:hypothetical protein
LCAFAGKLAYIFLGGTLLFPGRYAIDSGTVRY